MRGVRRGLGLLLGFLPFAGPGQQRLLTGIHLTFPTHPPSTLSICQSLHSYSSRLPTSLPPASPCNAFCSELLE